MKKIFIYFCIVSFFVSCKYSIVPEFDPEYKTASGYLSEYYHKQDTAFLDSALHVINGKIDNVYGSIKESFIYMKMQVYYLQNESSNAMLFLDTLSDEDLTGYRTKNLLRNNFLALIAEENNDSIQQQIFYSLMLEELSDKNTRKDTDALSALYRVRYKLEDKDAVRKEVIQLSGQSRRKARFCKVILNQFDEIDRQPLMFIV